MATLEHKKICLLSEVKTSIYLLKKGMSELQKISGSNDFYHLPVLLLSSGFERLIKCLLCLALMDDTGNLKTRPFKTSGREGHDLDILLNSLLLTCANRNYSSKSQAAKEDINMLANDMNLRRIITLLSEFAQGDRYYNLDIVLDNSSKSKNPTRGWDEIEKAVTQHRPDISMKMKDLTIDLDDIYKEINRELIIVLEKFTRALTRLFVFADFGDFAKQASILTHDYLLLDDNELGKRDYQKLTTQ